MQYHSKNFKILEFCSLILPPSQYSCTIRAYTILELKNTLSRFTVKNCEILIVSRPTQQIPFIYIFIEKQKISAISSPRENIETIIEQMEFVLPKDSFEVIQQGSRFSKDGKPAHYFEMKLVDDSRIKRTAFFRHVSSESNVYQISFWCPGARYEELVPVYDNIAASVDFRLH